MNSVADNRANDQVAQMNWDEILKTAKAVYEARVSAENNSKFNAFVLMSDLYRRENFHSDILRAILDPCSPHEEGNKFLRKFIEYLAEKCVSPDQVARLRRAAKEIDTTASVLREAGRIDILITGHFKSGKEWQIIVENKLNNAVDMPRQLPRYLDYYWKQDTHDQSVLALVYLKPSSDTESPSQYGWDDEAYGWQKERGPDVDRVRRKLITIAGYTNLGRNLAVHWLQEMCLPLTRRPNVRNVFEQYIDLLKIQSEEDMNIRVYADLFKALNECDDMSVDKLMSVVAGLPTALAWQMKEAAYDAPFKYKGIAYNTICFFDFNDVEVSGKKIWLVIDVDFCKIASESCVKISLFARTDRAGYESVDIGRLLKLECLSNFVFHDERLWFEWSEPLPRMLDSLEKWVEKLGREVFDKAPDLLGQ